MLENVVDSVLLFTTYRRLGLHVDDMEAYADGTAYSAGPTIDDCVNTFYLSNQSF